jgi:hypothetical protein
MLLRARRYHTTVRPVSRVVEEVAGGEVRPAAQQLRRGAVLLKAFDERLGLTERLAA